jgi:2-polyprenyl-3-methyl-5-hydroxy-6-metoxy-1,4-benzoquinol methylase
MNYTVEAIERLCQLDPTIMEDRARELAEFLGLSVDAARALYRAYNVERTVKVPRFDPSTFATIVAGYTNEHAFSRDLSRLMLHYTRYSGAAELLSTVRPLLDPAKRPSVVDYGCGVADYGLAFARAGYTVTLLDFEPAVSYASWRFQRRDLPVKTIAVTENNEYPRFEGADLVLAGDLLEHVRNPGTVIQNIHSALTEGGLFWFPDFPFKEKSVGGHHLLEAANLRHEAATLVEALFTPVGKVKHLMRKVASKRGRSISPLSRP